MKDIDITKLQQENEQLKADLKKAKGSYAAVNSFMSRTSHEIRTPVNSVIGLAELGLDECSDSTAKEYFTKIKASADYLLEILNDILDMARIESGSVTLYPESCTLESFADDICAVVTPLMDKKNIDFRFEFHDIFADTLIMDKLRLKQIFINLLSNAAKFTPEKGRVELNISQLSGSKGKVKTVFVVKDNGIGMSEEFLENIFVPFTQERTAATASIQGTGLGLPISKNLTELMGGTMSVMSILGKGTVFTVEIEFEPAENVAAVPYVKSMNYEGKRALIVDDHSINRILEVKVMKRAGFETDSAANGFECLKKYLASQPGYYDVILMDIKMPVMDGLEAAGKIRASGRSDADTVKLIAMSANAYPEDIQASKQAGMNAHIGKPVIPSVLLGELGKLMDSTQAPQKAAP